MVLLFSFPFFFKESLPKNFKVRSLRSRFASVMKQYPQEAAELFDAAQQNAQWRYRSYLRMLSTNWDKE